MPAMNRNTVEQRHFQHLPVTLVASGMFFFQAVLKLFIPSASGQALVTMPLMVPPSDLLNISRQTAVLAFIPGDGFSNLIMPTNGVLMARLGITAVPLCFTTVLGVICYWYYLSDDCRINWLLICSTV